MTRKQARYKKMEFYMTIALCVDVAIFIAYLFLAGAGAMAMKIVCAIACFGISGVVLYQLFMSRELLRKRSIWMTLAAVCIIICILVSLILKFPAPAFVLQ